MKRNHTQNFLDMAEHQAEMVWWAMADPISRKHGLVDARIELARTIAGVTLDGTLLPPALDLAYLPLVVEEAAEATQVAMKLLRFGPDHRYLQGEHAGRTNVEALAWEIGDLLEVLERLGLPAEIIEKGRERKRERLKMYGPHTWRPGIEDEVES